MSSRKLSRLALVAMIAAIGVGSASSAQADGGGGLGPVGKPGSGWVIMAGGSLKNTLEGWTRAAGWTLIWDSPIDYRMRSSATFQGSFEESATRLIDSIYIGNPELSAQFHRGNNTLHIWNQPLSSN